LNPQPSDVVGEAVALTVPTQSCSTFGPEVASVRDRPSDPDATGGYYAPVRFVLSADGPEPLMAFGFVRIKCALANASADAVKAFAKQYAPNERPQFYVRVHGLHPLRSNSHDADDAIATSPPDGASATSALTPREPLPPIGAVAPGATLHLRAQWSEHDAETYAWFDPAARAMTERRESIRVRWFVTAGNVQNAQVSRDERDGTTWADTSWTAPTMPRDSHDPREPLGVQLFAIARDSRGASAVVTFRVTVAQPNDTVSTAP